MEQYFLKKFTGAIFLSFIENKSLFFLHKYAISYKWVLRGFNEKNEIFMRLNFELYSEKNE